MFTGIITDIGEVRETEMRGDLRDGLARLIKPAALISVPRSRVMVSV